jgi:hypothetical protein
MVRSEGPAAGREVIRVVVSLAAVIRAAADRAEVIQVAGADMSVDMAVAEVMAAGAATDVTERQAQTNGARRPSAGSLLRGYDWPSAPSQQRAR